MEPDRYMDLDRVFFIWRWRMIDADLNSYFCIYLFLSRGMSKPLLPKAITAGAQACILRGRHFFAIPAENKHESRDNLVTNVAQVNCIVPF